MSAEKLLAYYRNLIDEKINFYLPETDKSHKKVVEASRYSLLLGGKRIRPAIMLMFSKALGGNTEEVIPFAVALEMIHTYSLIHDDLPCMDNDDMRRGKPSCHKAFGEDTALLAGDKLLTTAFSVAASSGAEPERVIKCIGILAERANGMINGQVMDLKLEKENPTVDSLKKMYILKTGCLISAAAEIGCILAGGDEETLVTAKGYALNLALAFQIIDDILDIVGDSSILGKPIGSDEQNGKTTYASLLGLENAEKEAEMLTNEAIGLLGMIKGNTSDLEELTRFLLSRNY